MAKAHPIIYPGVFTYCFFNGPVDVVKSDLKAVISMGNFDAFAYQSAKASECADSCTRGQLWEHPVHTLMEKQINYFHTQKSQFFSRRQFAFLVSLLLGE